MRGNTRFGRALRFEAFLCSLSGLLCILFRQLGRTMPSPSSTDRTAMAASGSESVWGDWAGCGQRPAPAAGALQTGAYGWPRAVPRELFEPIAWPAGRRGDSSRPACADAPLPLAGNSRGVKSHTQSVFGPGGQNLSNRSAVRLARRRRCAFQWLCADVQLTLSVKHLGGKFAHADFFAWPLRPSNRGPGGSGHVVDVS